jgi:acyl-CoA synthetase (NDP forming)
VIACRDAEDLARTALFLTEQPLPAGQRLAIVSNAGGMGVLAADAATEVGLHVPEFSPELCGRLAELVHGTAGTSNPVDAGAGVAPAELAGMVDIVLASGEADVVLVIPVATGVTDGSSTMAELDRVRTLHPELPVVVVPLGGLDGRSDAEPPITAYRTTASAVLAVSRAVRYAEWLDTPRVPVVPQDARSVELLHRRIGQLLLQHRDPCWLDLAEASDVLGRYGLSPSGGVAESVEGAVRLAESVGFPVALKIADPQIVHKTERGLVRVGIGSTDEVRRVVAEFSDELGWPAPVVVQPVLKGVEVAVGVVRDPALGPLVMVAAGGVATDVWNDRVFLVPPISEADVTRAVRSLRIWPLMDGFRGSEPVDVQALVDLVVAVGRVAVDVPELAELDLNPVLVGTDRCSIVDVKLRLARRTGPDRSAPRQLRPLGS